MNGKKRARGKKPDAAADPPPAPPKRRVGRPRTTGSGVGPIIGFRVSAAEYAELVAEATAKGLASPSAAAAARAFPNRGVVFKPRKGEPAWDAARRAYRESDRESEAPKAPKPRASRRLAK